MDMERMAYMMGAMRNKPKPVSGEEAAKYRESFKHIEGIQPGDKVRWKGPEYKTNSIPEITDIVEVFRVGEPGTIGNRGDHGEPYENDEQDFTVAYKMGDGSICEYAFDSRRFERVE